MSDLAELAVSVADDPEIKRAVVDLTLTALAEARKQLLAGRPDQKAAIIRALLPALAKSLQERGAEDEGIRTARDAFTQLLEQVRGTTT